MACSGVMLLMVPVSANVLPLKGSSVIRRFSCSDQSTPLVRNCAMSSRLCVSSKKRHDALRHHRPDIAHVLQAFCIGGKQISQRAEVLRQICCGCRARK